MIGILCVADTDDEIAVEECLSYIFQRDLKRSRSSETPFIVYLDHALCCYCLATTPLRWSLILDLAEIDLFPSVKNDGQGFSGSEALGGPDLGIHVRHE